MNYLTAHEVKEIIHLCAFQIRLFLGNSNPDDFKGDARSSIIDFHKNPSEYSDDALLEKGANVDDAHQYAVRIELRGISPKGAAQVVAKGIWGPARKKAITILRKELIHHTSPLSIRLAGSSSFEFNRAGVDKSLPIRYLAACWPEILKTMKYTPGEQINSLLSKTVIAADGDGTIYDGPKTTHLPTLFDSPVFDPIIRYLKAGGIFMLVSGNDLGRSFNRLIHKIPKELHQRILIAANGGADLAYVDAADKPHFLDHYRLNALDVVANAKDNPIDIIYLGDDHSPDGNDYAAFGAVGKDRAFMVDSLQHSKSIIENWLNERKINPA